MNKTWTPYKQVGVKTNRTSCFDWGPEYAWNMCQLMSSNQQSIEQRSTFVWEIKTYYK
jgi:hypothetical protein